MPLPPGAVARARSSRRDGDGGDERAARSCRTCAPPRSCAWSFVIGARRKRLDLAADLARWWISAPRRRRAAAVRYLPKLTPGGAANLLAGLRRVGAAVAPRGVHPRRRRPHRERPACSTASARSSDADDDDTLVDVSVPARATRVSPTPRPAASPPPPPASSNVAATRPRTTAGPRRSTTRPPASSPDPRGTLSGTSRLRVVSCRGHRTRARLSSTELTLHEITAVFSRRASTRGRIHPPRRMPNHPPRRRRRHSMVSGCARVDASDGVWTNAELVVEPRGIGPVAL